MKSTFKFKKIQCFDNAIEFMLVQSAGRSHPLINGMVNEALIAQLKISCEDRKTLRLKFAMRATKLLDFDPTTVSIDLKADLLYPDVAFGTLGADGVVYEKINFEYSLLHVFHGNKENVPEMKEGYKSGDNLAEILAGPTDWINEPNIIGNFEDCILK